MKITEISPQKKQKNRLNVFVDGEFSFGIDEFDLAMLKLKEGMEISESEIASIKEKVILSKAKDYSLSLVARRFYTEKGIKRKLFDKGYDEDTVNSAVAFLKEYNYIDDNLYARKYIDECVNLKKYGRTKIKMSLIEKGVDADIISKAMSEFDFDEIESNLLSELVAKKLGGNFEYKNILKVKRFFVSKGYDYSLVDSAIRKAKEGFEPDDFFE